MGSLNDITVVALVLLAMIGIGLLLNAVVDLSPRKRKSSPRSAPTSGSDSDVGPVVQS